MHSDVKRRARRPILSIKKKANGENIALLAANLGWSYCERDFNVVEPDDLPKCQGEALRIVCLFPYRGHEKGKNVDARELSYECQFVAEIDV